MIQETGKPFGDGSHIIYVNALCKNDTPLGKLMHDFSCTQADDMHYPVLAERVRYFKENVKGVTTMCREIEKLVIAERNESRLGQYRAIRQEVSDRIFASIQSLENEGILYVFLVFQTEEVGQKGGGDSQTQLCGGALEEKTIPFVQSWRVCLSLPMKLLKTPESGRDIIRSLIEQ